MGTRDSAPAPGLALAALCAAAAVPLLRVFSGASWMAAALAAAVGPHLIAAWADRRSRPRTGFVALVSAAVGVAFCTVVVEPASTFYGMPTPSALGDLLHHLAQAPDVLRTAVVPVEPGGAALLLALASLWAASMTAVRLDRIDDASLLAVTPSLVLFVAVIALGSGPDLAATVVYSAAIGAYLLARRMEHLARSYSWFAGARRRHAMRRLAAGGLAAGALALAAGAALGPVLPGASGAALLDYRELGEDRGSGRWQTISPLVDIRGRLVQNPAAELFTVRSNRAAYWRIVALDQFDGDAWALGEKEAPPVGDALDGFDGSTGPVDSYAVRQHFRIGSLSSRWLPAAYRPTEIELTDAYVIEEVLTLVAADDLSAGLEYEVVSEIAVPDAAELARSSPVRGGEWSRYLDLPPGFPERVTDLARGIVAASDTPYDRAIALQDWLRDPERFTYTLDARSGHGSSAIETFLFETRRGYCEQFAGTFAAMARSVGLPARVAVGFTPGTLDPAAGVYRVTSTDAHAWPEVYLSGIGWTAFEPTPGRFEPTPGDPTGTQAEREAGTPPPTATTAAPTPTTTVPGGVLPSMPRPGDARGIDVETGARPDAQSKIGQVLAALAVAVALAIAAAIAYVGIASIVVVRRRARRRRAATNRERVTGAWDEAIDRLAEAGIERRPSSTPVEFALRHAPAHGAGAAGPALMDLARLHTAAVFGAREPDDDTVSVAWHREGEIRVALRETVRAGPRWRRRLAPRRVLRTRP